MIVNNKMMIKVAKNNIEHYIKFFDVNLGDMIEIDVDLHLQKQSNKKINVQCDMCNIERYIKYQAYTKNISSCKKYPIYTCDKCSHIKLKEYNKEHYGVEYYSQHPDRNDKVIATSLDKYGAAHFSQSKFFAPKVAKTNLEKFGFINPFMDKDRIKRIFKDKYGVEHPSLIPEINKSIRKTNEDNNNWTKQSDRSNFELYKSIVRKQTKKSFIWDIWDGYDFYDGEYIKSYKSKHYNDDLYPTIDHKISIYEGFKNNLSTWVISSIDNLCITKRIINLKKHK